MTFMLQPLKMQGEAKNCKNGHFCALRTRLRALRARDLDAGHCSTGVLTRRTFGPSFVTLPLCLAPFFALKPVFWRALRAIVRATRAGLQNPTVGTGVLDRPTFGPSFVALQPCLPPLLL